MTSHTDGYICFLHIVNTFSVAHLHTLLMMIFEKVMLNFGPVLVLPISLNPGTREKGIALACSTYIDIFKFY
jgi:hypothetical protein